MDLSTLDTDQLSAVVHPGRRLLVRAGAGAGKTRILTVRAARRLMEGCHHSEILLLTFTRRATAEMRDRLAELVGPRGRRVVVSTFHSWAVRILREWHDLVPISREFSIYDQDDSDDLLAWCALEMGDKGVQRSRDNAEAKGKRWRMVSRMRDRLMRDSGIVVRYLAQLREAQALTYDGLELTLLRLMGDPGVATTLRHRYQHVLVDEYQDTSEIQQAILARLAPEHLFRVGDHAQSIYAFRGAHVAGFEAARIEAEWVLQLPTNYRSLPAIVAGANRCASRMAVPGLEMEARREGDSPLYLQELTAPDRDELHGVIAQGLRDAHDSGLWPEWSDLAVLSPTWDLLYRLAPALEAAGIPHRIARHALDVWETEEARWVLDCLRAAANPHDHLALRRALNALSVRVTLSTWASLRAEAIRHGCTELSLLDRRGLPPVDVIERAACDIAAPGRLPEILAYACTTLGQDLIAQHRDHRVDTLADFERAAVRWIDQQPDGEQTIQHLLTWYSERRITDPEVQDEEDAVTLITAHGAKGLEWPCVWVLGLEEGRWPTRRAVEDPDEMEESRRLLYVALTRGRDRVRLCWSGHRERSGLLEEVLHAE